MFSHREPGIANKEITGRFQTWTRVGYGPAMNPKQIVTFRLKRNQAPLE